MMHGLRCAAYGASFFAVGFALALPGATLGFLASTAGATAILEAGRRSLDAGGAPFDLVYADDASCTPIDMKLSAF